MAKLKTPTTPSPSTISTPIADKITEMPTVKADQSFISKLADYISASYPIIYVSTHEEARVDKDVNQAVLMARTRNMTREIPTEGLNVFHWNCVDGFKKISYNVTDKSWVPSNEIIGTNTGDLNQALKHITDTLSKLQFATFVFHDIRFKFLNLMAAEAYIRRLRDLARKIPNAAVCFIFVGAVFDPPIELEQEVQSMEYSLPDEEHIRNKFDDIVRSTESSLEKDNETTKGSRKVIAPTNDTIVQLVEAAKGLTSNQLSNVFALATKKAVLPSSDVDFNLPEFSKTVFAEKIKQVKKTGALEYLDIGVTFDQIGGLHGVKSWVGRRKKGYSAEARALGIPAPRGILLSGIPGNGKSMIAKAIATEFNAPLFQLDIGKLFSHLVGASEANLRYTLKVIEAIGRSVILIDEIDKTLNSNSTNGQGDSGVSARMFGTLLSWMNDRVVPAFIVMTCNDHTIIPQELLRKGRMDATFWTDVPSPKARTEIFKVCLARRGFDVKKFSPKALAEKADMFVGAEIEAVIVDAMYSAFDKGVPLNDDIILTEIVKMTPQAESMTEKLEKLRNSSQGKLLDADAEITDELSIEQQFNFNA